MHGWICYVGYFCTAIVAVQVVAFAGLMAVAVLVPKLK